MRSLDNVEVLPARGFATHRDTFELWAGGQRGLLLENFYRDARRRLDLLMEGAEPVGGRWNFDADNREPPPKGAEKLDLDGRRRRVRRPGRAWETTGWSRSGRTKTRCWPATGPWRTARSPRR